MNQIIEQNTDPMKKVYKIILFVLLPLFLVIILAVLLAAPYGIKRYINEHGQEYTGRMLSVQDITITYFPVTFSLMDFKMLEADGKGTFVSFDTLAVKISPIPLLSSKLVVEQFRLVHPAVSIVRKDTTFNFDDILRFLKSKPKTEEKGKPSKAFAYFLKNLGMEKGNLTFTDKNVNHTYVLKDLGFFIPDISFNQNEIKDAGVKFNFENGGSFQAKTDFDQKSGSYKADFSVEKLDISPFLPYAQAYFQIKEMAGLVGGDFHLAGNINKLDSLLFRGKGRAENFSASDLTGHKVVGAKSANVIMKDSYPMKFDFRFDQIELNEPSLYVAMKDSDINLFHLMVESPADTVPFNYAYQINKFRIAGGTMDLRDNSYEEPFDYHLSEVEMKLDSVSSTAKWLNAFASMKLNQHGKLQAQLGINPSNPYELKVDYVINNFQLTDLNSYSKHFVGFPILLGNMYYKGKTVIANKQLTSENKLIVRNAKLGKKHGGIMNLPLKLALYLLKDIHGDIILDLPLTGDLNNPQTKIGKLVWQVLKNVVVKVVASPFIALGGLLGVEPAEVKGIEFNYADTTLTATHLKRIKLYTELEKKKPDMKIELNYFNDIGLEKKEIALNEAGKLFSAATGADYKKEEAKFKTFLTEKIHKDSLSIENGSIQLIGEHKLDSIQQSISQKRIRKIEEALLSIDNTSKIKVVTPNKEAPDNVGSRPVFQLKYSVEE